jgi:hypothetical protein
MFDPNSITPSEELLDDWRRAGPDSSIHGNELFKDYILAARWGAAQAFEALRHQWPEPIKRQRRPTEEDGDECGFVQYLFSGRWNYESWENVAKKQQPVWLHTPNWRPKPEPTPKQRALELLRLAANEELVAGGFSPDAIALLVEVVESAPEATP